MHGGRAVTTLRTKAEGGAGRPVDRADHRRYVRSPCITSPRRPHGWRGFFVFREVLFGLAAASNHLCHEIVFSAITAIEQAKHFCGKHIALHLIVRYGNTREIRLDYSCHHRQLLGVRDPMRHGIPPQKMHGITLSRGDLDSSMHQAGAPSRLG